VTVVAWPAARGCDGIITDFAGFGSTDVRAGSTVNDVRSNRRRRHFWWWFLVPSGSLGLAAFPIILYAAIRTRSRWSLATTPIYLGITLWTFLSNAANTPISLDVVVCMVGGSAHALYLSWLFSQQLAAEAANTAREAEPAIVTARAAIARRYEARLILQREPTLAEELRIGRPDLPRTYDDGGLIDVNHVPAEILVTALEMQPAVANEIVELRAGRSGFVSADDLLIACESLNPERLDIVRDRLIFVPRDRHALE
jgi:hypothetical protein